MVLPSRVLKAIVASLVVTLHFGSGSANAEEITVFDASCIQKEMLACFECVDLALQVERTRKELGAADRSPGSEQAEAIKKRLSKVSGSYTDQCNKRQRLVAETRVSDCAEIGKANPACVKKVGILTASDIREAQQGFTKQLDEWLDMLESAGVVDRYKADSTAVAPPSTP